MPKLDIGRAARRLGGSATREAGLFLVAAMLSVLAIVEVTARERSVHMLRLHKERVTSELLKLETRSEGVDQQKSKNYMAELSRIELCETWLKILVLSGTESGNTLPSILNGCLLGADIQSKGVKVEGVTEYFVSYAMIPQRLLEQLSSEHLIAIGVLACGVLGTIIASLRAGTRTVSQQLLLGLATGFIVFIGIRGGKAVFLLESSGAEVTLNPYSSCFASLLAGLFSERAYGLLSLMVDALTSRISAVVGPAQMEPAAESEPANQGPKADG